MWMRIHISEGDPPGIGKPTGFTITRYNGKKYRTMGMGFTGGERREMETRLEHYWEFKFTNPSRVKQLFKKLLEL